MFVPFQSKMCQPCPSHCLNSFPLHHYWNMGWFVCGSTSPTFGQWSSVQFCPLLWEEPRGCVRLSVLRAQQPHWAVGGACVPSAPGCLTGVTRDESRTLLALPPWEPEPSSLAPASSQANIYSRAYFIGDYKCSAAKLWNSLTGACHMLSAICQGIRWQRDFRRRQENCQIEPIYFK